MRGNNRHPAEPYWERGCEALRCAKLGASCMVRNPGQIRQSSGVARTIPGGMARVNRPRKVGPVLRKLVRRPSIAGPGQQ
jgi:hypothetical protein